MGSRWHIGLPLALMLSACGDTSTSPSAATAGADTCNADLWNHVYDPSRLKTIDACRTVTGVVSDVHTNEDGDVDLRVAVDTPFANLVNDANRSQLNGHLQTEPICQAPPTVRDAQDACGTFRWPVLIPTPGQHVSVTGSYVLDTNHGWMEIHPVSVVRLLP